MFISKEWQGDKKDESKKNEKAFMWDLHRRYVISCCACGKQVKDSVYNQTLQNLNSRQTEYYAIVHLKNQEPILLVADAVYDEGSEKTATIDATSYTYNGTKVEKAASISSGGTAYPLRADENEIYAESAHEVKVYQMDHKKNTLIQTAAYEETFDSDGNASYTCRVAGKVKKIKENTFMQVGLDAKVLHFEKGNASKTN